MQSVRLNASSFSLRFDIQPNGWTTVYFESNEESIELGAEINHKLFMKLQDFLENKSEKAIAGNIRNRPVVHIFSLFEKHTSVYAAINQQTTILFFQSSEGNIFAEMRLTETEMNNWLHQLSKI